MRSIDNSSGRHSNFKHRIDRLKPISIDPFTARPFKSKHKIDNEELQASYVLNSCYRARDKRNDMFKVLAEAATPSPGHHELPEAEERKSKLPKLRISKSPSNIFNQNSFRINMN